MILIAIPTSFFLLFHSISEPEPGKNNLLCCGNHHKKMPIILTFFNSRIETYFLSFVQHIRWSEQIGCNR